MNIHFIASKTDSAQASLFKLIARYGQSSLFDATTVVVLGGDGTMLGAIHQLLANNRDIPVYGINHGNLGFLLNEDTQLSLDVRLNEAHQDHFHPLKVTATHNNGSVTTAWAVNDVCASRMGAQAIRLKVKIDGEVRLPFFSGDGMIVSTDLGSTAYNRSAHGPIIPLGANILAMTPICAFQPIHFHGALLDNRSVIEFDVIDGEYRRGFFAADNQEIYDVQSARIEVDKTKNFTILFDPGVSLNQKRLKEQFFN